MHSSSFENMRLCYEKYIVGSPLEKRRIKVIDIGEASSYGTFSDLFRNLDVEFLVTSNESKHTTNIGLQNSYSLPFSDRSVDVVLSGRMFEQSKFFWNAFKEMVRVCKHDGFIFVVAPSSGSIHKHSVDYYRFCPDAFKALAIWADCAVLDIWHDRRGSRKDLIAVFSPQKQFPENMDNIDLRGSWTHPPLNNNIGPLNETTVLKDIHNSIKPNGYLQVGVSRIDNLELPRCLSFGLDPHRSVLDKLSAKKNVQPKTSYSYWYGVNSDRLPFRPNMTLIEGRRRFSDAIVDFIHAEKESQQNGVIIINNIMPGPSMMKERPPYDQNMIGDVWKIALYLSEVRPDLRLDLINTDPSGLLIISNTKPDSDILLENYNNFSGKYENLMRWQDESHLLYNQSISEGTKEYDEFLKHLERRPGGLRHWLDKREHKKKTSSKHLFDLKIRPKISVIVNAYNMARELPRTLQSLSHPIQKGLSTEDYEIIVVDNGSTKPFDIEACKNIAKNILFLNVDTPSVSPSNAINLGIAHANADTCVAMIDGARMASPGLLQKLLEASKIGKNTIIGTIAFHIGPEVQMVSVTKGYNQHVEDKLLAAADWEKNGYKLFDISVFAGSSAKGWFALPAESNAICMHKDMWRDLDGFDISFIQPGGGLVNHDIWKRACELPNNRVIMLLGEATFHQFHGGVATNARHSKLAEFRKEYEKIRGHPYSVPNTEVSYYGTIRQDTMDLSGKIVRP